MRCRRRLEAPPATRRHALPTRQLQRVCVLCGSSPGRQAAYSAAARQLARLLAERGIGVVCGGATAGLMGVVAESAAAAGGEVTVVMTPELAAKEGHGDAQLEIVSTMHQRKRRFSALADAYVALPGGFGTLEELFEALAWNQLGIHHKPTGLLNAAGYYDRLLRFLRHAEGEAFVPAKHLASLRTAEDPEALIDALAGALRSGS